MSVVALLADVSSRVTHLREEKHRSMDRLAPDFRIFDYLRTDEYGLSRCLAGLLDPEGKHGQGRVFLDALIERIEPAGWVRGETCDRVRLEEPTDANRRIDIYLEFRHGVVGIENKPWAGDQNAQLSHYADYLRKIAGEREWLLLFLSNREPGRESISKKKSEQLTADGHYARLNYSELISWLNVCAARSKAPTVKIFIEELVKFIRTDVNYEIDMREENEIRDIVLSSADNLNTAFLIEHSLDEAKRYLIDKLKVDLESSLENRNYHLSWDKEVRDGDIYAGFRIGFIEGQKKCLRFEFQQRNFCGFAGGIDGRKYARNEQEVDEIHKIMSTIFGNARRSEYWPWWEFAKRMGFESEFEHWPKSSKPWLAIQDQSLATKIVNIADKVYEVFKDRMDLLMAPHAGANRPQP